MSDPTPQERLDQANQDVAAGNASRDAANTAAANTEAARVQAEAADRAGSNQQTQANLKGATAAANQAKEAATNANNRAELASIRAEAAKTAIEVAALQAKVEGMRITTDFDWENRTGKDWKDFIKGNYSLKVIGSEHKINLSHVLSIVLGHKLEVCCLGKYTFIAPFERKDVIGWSITWVNGMRKDVVRGAKWELIYGIKVETHHGHKVTIGPSESTSHPQEQSKIGSWFEKKAEKRIKINDEVTEVDTHNIDINKLTADVAELIKEVRSANQTIGSTERKFGEYTLKAKKLDLKAERLETSSKSDMKFEGKGARLQLDSFGAKLSKDSSNISLSSSSLWLSAPGTFKIL